MALGGWRRSFEAPIPFYSRWWTLPGNSLVLTHISMKDPHISLPDFSSWLQALKFAAIHHQYERRNGYDRLPYVNHLIKVAEILVRVGEETDGDTLKAAVLHDVVEDTDVTLDDLRKAFGDSVAAIVEELTDDMALSYEARKSLQIERAPGLSLPAKKIRIADKGANIQDIFSYPLTWTRKRKQEYLLNSQEIVRRLAGTHAGLEAWFDQQVAWAQSKLEKDA